MNFDHISKHSSMGKLLISNIGSNLRINHGSDYRMYFHPREKYKMMPLVIINFEGIIGEILTLPLLDPEAKKGLYLKNGVVDNMKRLLNKFRIALVTSIPQKIFDKILKYFHSFKIKFDAVYFRKEIDRTNHLFSEYNHIYEDFEIEKEDVKWNVLILCPVLLENEELRDRK